MTKPFAVFDSDSHVVEPRAVWEDYLEPEFRTLGKNGPMARGRPVRLVSQGQRQDVSRPHESEHPAPCHLEARA